VCGLRAIKQQDKTIGYVGKHDLLSMVVKNPQKGVDTTSSDIFVPIVSTNATINVKPKLTNMAKYNNNHNRFERNYSDNSDT
jgi:hypothetical protein